VRTDELVLQVCNAHVETEPFHLDASQLGAEAGALETTPEVAFLAGVTKAGEADVEPLGSVLTQEPPDCLRAANRHDGDALGFEIPATALSQRFDCVPVADSFDQHDRARFDF
jgi:hypothetical protein